MSSNECIEQLKKGIAQAAAALDNVVGAIAEIEADVLIAAVHPALIEARSEASEALRRAEVAITHLERIGKPEPERAVIAA